MRKILLVVVLSVFLVSFVSACGISPARHTASIHPGEIDSWRIGLYMEDNNGDGLYQSTMNIDYNPPENPDPHPELKWASLSNSEYVESINVESTTGSADVWTYLNTNTKDLPFGQNYFYVGHSCECSGGGIGSCMKANFQSIIYIIPYDIKGITASFSKDRIIMRWDKFVETGIDSLKVLRMDSPITIKNYQNAEVLATLSADSTYYEFVNPGACSKYYYAVYGFTNRLMANSSNVIVDVSNYAMGDVNNDGKVDSADLAIWQRNYDPLGKNANTPETGDVNNDGRIDSADLAIWQREYAPLGIGECESKMTEVLPVILNEVLPIQKLCIDNSDEYKQGCVKVIRKDGITFQMCDSCRGNIKLIEYSCNGGSLIKEKIACSNGCFNGACKR